ncbi:hypothetical protein BH23PAT1_BH23PAT1_0720 [soil metagenome]
MPETIQIILKDWNLKHSERQKMQHAYLSVGIAGVVVAGLFSLVNAELGQRILSIALAALAVFVINMLFWALMFGLVISKLPAARNRK